MKLLLIACLIFYFANESQGGPLQDMLDKDLGPLDLLER